MESLCQRQIYFCKDSRNFLQSVCGDDSLRVLEKIAVPIGRIETRCLEQNRIDTLRGRITHARWKRNPLNG